MANKDEPANDNALLLTVSAAARLMGISRGTIYNHAAAGCGVPLIRVGNGTRIERAAIMAYIASAPTVAIAQSKRRARG